jgi:hypothetical protein
MCAKESESVHNATGGMEAVLLPLSPLSPLRSVIESEKKRDNLRDEEVTESP